MGINGDSKRKGCIAILIFLIAISANITFHVPTAMGSPVYVAGEGNGGFNIVGSENTFQVAQTLEFGAENFDLKSMHFKSPFRYLTSYTFLSGDGHGPEDDSNADLRLIDEAGRGLFIPLMTNGFYNLMFFEKPTSILTFLVMHILFFVFCIGIVVAYTNAGASPLTNPSFRDAMKVLLPLLFAGFLCMLFPYIATIYNVPEDSAYVQISKENGVVTVENEKGAVIHSGPDDADAIEAALAESEGRVILFERGEYDIDRTIRLKSEVSFVGNDEVVFNCISSPAFNTGTGGYSSSTISLSSDANSGDTQIKLSSVSGLNVGDYVKISDEFSVPFQRNDYKNGELAEIIDISGSTITVDRPLYDDYTVARNAQVRKISMFKNISFENINFIGYGMDTSSTAIYFYGVTNIMISNCGFEDFGNRAVSFWDCLDCIVEGSTFKRVFKDGTGYGIAITNACDNIVIRDNSFLEKGRHYIAVVAGRGGVTTDGFTRNVDVTNNVFRDCADEAVNSHPTSAAVFRVNDNEFYDCRKGVEFSNSDSVITNNTFVRCANGVVLFDTGNHLIEGNSFRENRISIIPHNTNSVTRDNSFENSG
ncbi:MAG: right-handed parallel beta-helix repeat-containing protein [Methanosarcinaceae archaeon]